MDLAGFEPAAFRMQSGRATTALKPHMKVDLHSKSFLIRIAALRAPYKTIHYCDSISSELMTNSPSVRSLSYTGEQSLRAGAAPHRCLPRRRQDLPHYS